MKRMITDADTGVDDPLAILYTSRSPSSHVEGITTCFGNNNAEQSADSCLRLVRLSGCGYEMPVAAGSNESLDGVFDSTPAHIHGDNGIGNMELPESSQKSVDETAWDFIIRKVGELKGELTIITAGWMTNLAHALERDPELPSKVKKMVTMGKILKEPGNMNPYAEINIHRNVKAVDWVFRAGFNLAPVGPDAATKTFTTGKGVKNLCTCCREECRTIADYIRDVLKFYSEFHRVSMDMTEVYVAHDPLTVLTAEDPSLGVSRMVGAEVKYEYESFRGIIKTDMGFVPVPGREEIAVYVEVDSEKAVRRLFSLFQDMTPGRYNRK